VTIHGKSHAGSSPAALALAGVLWCAGPAFSAPCPAPVCIESVEVDGRPAAEGPDVMLRAADDAREHKVVVTAGTPVAEGTVIEAPVRPRVRLRLVTRNGNTITLQPGGRLRVENVGERGERYTQLLGETRFAVTRALSFFEVAHDRFLAAVKGTEFGVAIDDKQAEIRFEWVKGEVLVEHEVSVTIEEQDSGASADDDDADGAVLVEREFLSEARGELRYRLGPRQYLKEFRTFRDAEQYFREQLAQDEKSGDPQRIQRGLLALGTILDTIGKPKAALAVLERALELVAIQKDESREALLARRIGLTYRDLKEYPKATAMLQRWLSIEERRSRSGLSLGVARAYTALGRTAGYAGDARGWVASVERAVAVHKRLDPGEEREETAAGYKNLADAYWAAGQRENAMPLYRASLALKQKLQPSGVNWAIANSLRDLGLRHVEMGETDAGIGYLQKALDGRMTLFGGVHPSIAVSYDDLGRAYDRAGDRVRALANFGKALDLRLQLFPDGVHRSIARSYLNLSRVARDSGDAKSADQYEMRARDVRSKLER